jgi:hypothetical protein
MGKALLLSPKEVENKKIHINLLLSPCMCLLRYMTHYFTKSADPNTEEELWYQDFFLFMRVVSNQRNNTVSHVRLTQLAVWLLLNGGHVSFLT